MALPTSGPLKFSDIQAELDGTEPISLSEYYGAASGLPESGSLSVSDFYGVSGAYEVVIVVGTTYDSKYGWRQHGYNQGTYGSLVSSTFPVTLRFVYRWLVEDTGYTLYSLGLVGNTTGSIALSGLTFSGGEFIAFDAPLTGQYASGTNTTAYNLVVDTGTPIPNYFGPVGTQDTIIANPV